MPPKKGKGKLGAEQSTKPQTTQKAKGVKASGNATSAPKPAKAAAAPVPARSPRPKRTVATQRQDPPDEASNTEPAPTQRVKSTSSGKQKVNKIKKPTGSKARKSHLVTDEQYLRLLRIKRLLEANRELLRLEQLEVLGDPLDRLFFVIDQLDALAPEPNEDGIPLVSPNKTSNARKEKALPETSGPESTLAEINVQQPGGDGKTASISPRLFDRLTKTPQEGPQAPTKAVGKRR